VSRPRTEPMERNHHHVVLPFQTNRNPEAVMDAPVLTSDAEGAGKEGEPVCLPGRAPPVGLAVRPSSSGVKGRRWVWSRPQSYECDEPSSQYQIISG
jgi:hypothetical protein